jgi:hypothetical protein
MESIQTTQAEEQADQLVAEKSQEELLGEITQKLSGRDPEYLESVLDSFNEDEQSDSGEQDKIAKRQQLYEKIQAELLEKTKKILLPYNPMIVEKALEEALLQVRTITDRVKKLSATEQKLRELYDNLDIKAKLVVATLLQVQTVESYISFVVEFISDTLYSNVNDEFVASARIKLQDDPDVEFLTETYKTADYICELENKW